MYGCLVCVNNYENPSFHLLSLKKNGSQNNEKFSFTRSRYTSLYWLWFFKISCLSPFLLCFPFFFLARIFSDELLNLYLLESYFKMTERNQYNFERTISFVINTFKTNQFEIQDSRRLKYFFDLMWFMRMPTATLPL